MSWFEKIIPSRINTEKRTRSVPEGIWQKCPSCGAQLYRAELERNKFVCPKCGHHMRIGARQRMEFLFDPNTGRELAEGLGPTDPLKFKDSKKYKERIQQAQKKTGEKDALIVMNGMLKGQPVVVCAFEFSYMGGSMGSVVGEKFSRAAKYARDNRMPLICFSASGGARMQEALFSLLQMAKTSVSLATLGEEGVPFVSVLTDPTTGGVSASLAMLGDVNIGEPRALIGFAGPRVIQQTVRETLPDGFQRSEFLLEHGALDMIIDRREMRDELANLLSKMLKQPAPAPAADPVPEQA